MQRYFVNQIDASEVVFSEEQIHHIVKVMRMNVNDELSVVYQGNAYLCYVAKVNPLQVLVKENLHEDHELKVDISLLYCVPKGDKLDLVVQKATELGVKEIILVQSSRCIGKITKENKTKKLSRLNKIALEASEQSKRTLLPIIKDVISYQEIGKYHFSHQFIAYENEDEISFKEHLEKVKNGESVGILIGAEGGFSSDEVDFAKQNGYISISLGKRILRSETAVMYALACMGMIFER
jgi:16S rRNA (uracil1498-N3)-methyltransferase